MTAPAIHPDDARLFRVFAAPSLTVSQWAEAHRVLQPDKESARPGPWRNSVAPYLTGIMDAVHRPGVEEIVVLKAAQVGYSEALRNVLGWVTACDPGPTLVVMPTDDTLRELFAERINPMFKATPSLRPLLTGREDDVTHSGINFRHMHLYGGAAASPGDLATRPIRFLALEEFNRYEQTKEGDPVVLARKRTATFGRRRRILMGGTPTDETGLAWREYESCRQHFTYWVPCPRCGAHQPLDFANVRWPKNAVAGDIKDRRLAWYECRECKGRIEESEKAGMLRRGRWVEERQTVKADGSLEPAELEAASSLGFNLQGEISAFVTWSELAHDFVKADGDPVLLKAFVNTGLGQIFRQQVAASRPEDFAVKLLSAPPAGLVPSWAQLLLAGVDTQKRTFVYVVRAWGSGRRSRLIAEGEVATLDDVRRLLNTAWPTEAHDVMSVSHLAIDSGGGLSDSGASRTQEVYAFAETDPGRILPFKGRNYRGDGQPIQLAPIRPGKSNEFRIYQGVLLYKILPDYFKDALVADIRWELARPEDTPDTPPRAVRFELNDAVGDTYVREMTGERKVIDQRTKRQTWRKTSRATPNHRWDCEVMIQALAHHLHVDALPDLDRLPPPPPRRREPRDFGFGTISWRNR